MRLFNQAKQEGNSNGLGHEGPVLRGHVVGCSTLGIQAGVAKGRLGETPERLEFCFIEE